MIPEETKKKFLEELERSGNVYYSCAKVGINRATFYRWRQEDKKLKKLANMAIRNGRANACDIAEHALLLNVKDRKMEAIKYTLSHNSPRYKPQRTSRVIIEHHSSEKIPIVPSRTIEDILKDDEMKLNNE